MISYKFERGDGERKTPSSDHALSDSAASPQSDLVKSIASDSTSSTFDFQSALSTSESDAPSVTSSGVSPPYI